MLTPLLAILLLAALIATPVKSMGAIGDSGDRAVVIAKQSRDRVERNGKILKDSSSALFEEFARRTQVLQELLDTHKNLEEGGFLDKNDPDGRARRANLNAKILVEVGELKKVCDQHVGILLRSLENFDDAVSKSLMDTQATRSINSNYELALGDYLQKEKTRFESAALDAEQALEEYQEASDPRLKDRLKSKYLRAKRRLVVIDQARQRFETRMKIAMQNQKITALIRDKIRETGNHIPDKFRDVLSDLYNTFAKVVPVAEAGGTSGPEFWENFGFSNLEEVSKTLDIVSGATSKLNLVLDGMVDDVLSDLGKIEVIKDSTLTTESIDIQEEMDFLNKQRLAWQK
jgi:hypothetical protein